MANNLQYSPNDLNRLMAAAVIDRDFCKLLLTNPVHAIGQGYYGEHFQLPAETQSELGAIHTASLSEFAQKITSSADSEETNHFNTKFIQNGKRRPIYQTRNLYDVRV